MRHQVTRNTYLGGVKYDDLSYFDSMILSISKGSGISQRELANKLTERDLSEMFYIADASKEFLFEDEVVLFAKSLFDLELPRDKVWNYRKSEDKSSIFTRLIKDLYYETGKSVEELWLIVYRSELADWCVDEETAWPITPSNQLVYESFEILGLQEYFDPDKEY